MVPRLGARYADCRARTDCRRPEFRDHVKAILLQFASYADRGTIPNMIFGGNADNRDTSDAQLWLFTACSDLCRAEGGFSFLEQQVRNGKTLLETLISLAEGLIAGTPNGIAVDPESMLVFSPSHFTWMDTNYPAGTPRQGYPIEIQALWFAALRFLAEAVGGAAGEEWRKRSVQVAASISKYYVLKGAIIFRTVCTAIPEFLHQKRFLTIICARISFMP